MQYLVKNQIPLSTSRFILLFFNAFDKDEINFASFDSSQIELILTNRWRVAYVVLRLRLIESNMLQTKPISFPACKKHSQGETSIKINIKWILNSSRHNKKEHLHHISYYAAPIVVIQPPEKEEKHLLETDIKYSIYILKTFHFEYFGNWVFASQKTVNTHQAQDEEEDNDTEQQTANDKTVYIYSDFFHFTWSALSKLWSKFPYIYWSCYSHVVPRRLYYILHPAQQYDSYVLR